MSTGGGAEGQTRKTRTNCINATIGKGPVAGYAYTFMAETGPREGTPTQQKSWEQNCEAKHGRDSRHRVPRARKATR